MSTTIEGNTIGKAFNGKDIFKNLSFAIDPGVTCLFGKNGRGKSTLLRILGGPERDFSGGLNIMGQDAVRKPEEANQQRSFLPDSPVFYPKATTLDLLSFVSTIRKLDLHKVLSHSHEKFGLDELISKPLESQSLGQRKRSFFSVTLLSHIPVWILDEPTNGLDDQYQSVFFDEVRAHSARGGTILIATHDTTLPDKVTGSSFHLFQERLGAPVSLIEKYIL